MSQNKKTSMIAILLALLVSSSLAFAEKPYKVAFSPADLYLGHISYVEIKNDGQDPVIIREGQLVPEPAVLNAPIGPGDVIRTSSVRRCEIQFDTATIIRLDTDTELKIETILAQTLSTRDRTTNLVLSKGQLYIIYKEYDYRELFQIMTPVAALKFNRNTVALVKAAANAETDLQVRRGKATALYGPSAARAKGTAVGKMERLIVSQNGLAQMAAYAADTDFERWNEEINASFNDLHKGLSFLPKPVLRYSPAIVDWAQKYSSRYGRWVYDSIYGYAWCPDTNDVYPWMNWRPYFYGHWTRAYDQMFWVSDEPWGWVPYHLGVWVWDKNLGWIWIPGSIFASAWTGWEYFNGYYSWWPYGLGDWWTWSVWGRSYYNPYQYMYVYYALPYKTLTKISKKQLKKPDPPLPLPKDLKRVYNRFTAALEKQDPRLVASLEQSAKHMVFVRPADIHSPNIAEKALPLRQFLSAAELSNAQPGAADLVRRENPVAAAAWDWKKNIQLSAAFDSFWQAKESFKRIETFPTSTATPKIKAATVRFLDWNPDLAAVKQYGATIRYSCRTNEVQCPELGLTSRVMSVIGRSFRAAVGVMGDRSQRSSASSSSMTSAAWASISSAGSSSGSSSAPSSARSGSSSSNSQGHTKKD